MSSPQEEVPSFDQSMKKKKKKSSKVSDVTEGVEKLAVEDKEETENVEVEEKKEKKKKSKKSKDEDEEENEEKEVKKKKSSKSKKESEEGNEEENEGEAQGDVPFAGKKKKKTSKKSVRINDEEDVAPTPSEDDFNDENVEEGQVPWAGSDRDYSYEELAGRIYSLLHNNNPSFATKQKKYVMKPPVLNRIGTKKTAWANFLEICTILNRKPDHFLNYVLTELGTNGSVDGSYSLIIKGRFQPKQIENVIRHYISEYVACRTCKSPETSLKKENRLYFLCCQACGSTRSVAAIKKGFEAQVGKRKKEEK